MPFKHGAINNPLKTSKQAVSGSQEANPGQLTPLLLGAGCMDYTGAHQAQVGEARFSMCHYIVRTN